MIVGTVAADGTPHAQRAWGCSVVDETTVRILLDASDPVLREQLGDGGRIAVTSADVRTLTSVQLKGRVVELRHDPTPEDLSRCEAHNEELFAEIEQTDHYPRQLTERMVPPGYLVAVVVVEELYDQTPGPAAGSRVTGAA